MNIASTPEPTISDIEQTVQNGLEALRNAPLNDRIMAALKFLTPPGYRPIAQLEEDGRKKRSTAAASNWNPATGEIVIYFEPTSSVPSEPAVSKPSSAWITHEEAESLTDPTSQEVTPLQVQQCCVALADAEKAGKAFIALKWFRDEALPKYKFNWTTSPESRQQVLAKAIEGGAIQTSRIPNPKAPQHPTTTVALNRAEAPEGVTSRFKPIVVRGEPVSVSMMRDRGSI